MVIPSRCGLIHICEGTRGAPLPKELENIKFAMVYCELSDESSGSIHAIMSKLFCSEGVLI